MHHSDASSGPPPLFSLPQLLLKSKAFLYDNPRNPKVTYVLRRAHTARTHRDLLHTHTCTHTHIHTYTHTHTHRASSCPTTTHAARPLGHTHAALLLAHPPSPVFPASTRMWVLLVAALEGLGTPMTYSFQSVLPRLPGALDMVHWSIPAASHPSPRTHSHTHTHTHSLSHTHTHTHRPAQCPR